MGGGPPGGYAASPPKKRSDNVATYRYTAQTDSSITFASDTNPAKITVSGINGTISNADKIAKGVRGLMYLGGTAMFNEYDPTEAIQTLRKGFEEVS